MQNDEENRFFSTSVRAGRRTYFFDIKKTKAQKPYITITESKKITDYETGEFHFEKHRIFLYDEDFSKFGDAIAETLKKAEEFLSE